MPDGVKDDSGMPLGAVAKRLGVEGYLHKKRRPNGRLYFVEIVGVEPTTLCLQSRCSSQLSYTPSKSSVKELVVPSRLELLTPTLSV